MEKLNTLPIEYIGNKPRKNENITGSSYVWEGKGSVVHVPVAIAQRLLEPKYSGIWRLATDAPAPIAPPPGAPSKPAPRNAPVQPLQMQAVIGAIAELLSGEDASAHLDDTGAPRVESLSAKLGQPVSAEQRDAAWAEVMKETPAGA